jgi:hypothetical protein
MKREVAIPASIAVLSLAFVLPRDSQAMAPKNPPTPASESSAAVQSDAARRVIAQATLVKPLDARKIQSSQQFQATLSDKVQLKNGPELPRGTILIGTMAAGDAQAGGTSKLVLRFTEARLKGGQVVPIKATIVGVFPANSSERDDPRIWTSKSLRIDQTGVMSGVDLHSKIEDIDSGVFVSTKNDAVKLSVNGWIALAIEAQPDGRQQMN